MQLSDENEEDLSKINEISMNDIISKIKNLE